MDFLTGLHMPFRITPSSPLTWGRSVLSGKKLADQPSGSRSDENQAMRGNFTEQDDQIAMVSFICQLGQAIDI